MLEHHTHMTADLIDINTWSGDFLSIKGDGSTCRDLQQIQTPQKCGFTRTGRSDNNHFLSRSNMHINIFNDLIVTK